MRHLRLLLGLLGFVAAAQSGVAQRELFTPEDLAVVIDRAMGKDVEKRYQSGEEMARDLRACMHQAPAQRPDVDIEL